jgi:FAD/FMN-containing dehydrogenase
MTIPADEPATPMVGVGMPAALHLDAFGREIEDAFGHLPYLVGTAAYGKQWRDLVEAKRRYDPDNRLASGPDVFGGGVVGHRTGAAPDHDD